MASEAALTLLSDRPVVQGGQPDLLDRSAEAARLADLLRDSREAAPFTLAVHADWGMGKSSLLQQTADRLRGDPGVEVVWFNAWTAGGSGLEALIKSVLDRLDPRALRRLARAMSGESAAASWARVLARGLAGTVRMHHLVDGIWERLAVDARTRNNAQDLLRKALNEWTSGDSPPRRRTIVVFVDDLDRCPAETILAVCSAVKQYLNVPGLVFVFGCDRSIVEAAAAGSPGAERASGREFLEKIIQATYPIAAPDDAQVVSLIAGYARSAGAGALFEGAVADAVAQYAGRNPRRIKQLINRFVVEYRLDPEWASLGADALIRAALLHDLYPGFHRLLSQSPDRDPLEEFRGYLDVLKSARAAAVALPEGDAGARAQERVADLLDRAARFLEDHDVDHPGGSISGETVTRLEQELPEGFPALARDKTFLGLIESLTGGTDGEALRAKLRRIQLARTESAAHAPKQQAAASGLAPGALAGLRVLRLNSRRDDASLLSWQLVQAGAQVTEVATGDEALERIAEDRPHVVITNLYRPDYGADGFADVAAMRRANYTGAIIVYTIPVTPVARARAEEFSALISDSPLQVAAWVAERTAQTLEGGLPVAGPSPAVEWAPDLDGMRVLWLAPYRNLPLQRHLRARGADVAAALDLNEALAAVRAQLPDVVVADPFADQDGSWEVYAYAQELRDQVNYTGPVIVLSQRVTADQRSRAARAHIEATDDLAVMTRLLVRIARRSASSGLA